MSDDHDHSGRRELFGDPIYSYTDQQAIEDGVLIPLLTPTGIDTLHRVTATAFGQLRAYHGREREPQEVTTAYVLHELLPLAVPACHKDRDEREFLKTDYNFRVRKDGHLWYVPNEVGGITVMQAEDY